MANGHKWAFKTKLRARAFGWRGSQTAAARLKEAVAEIKTVGKSNPLVAGEGALALMERLWPAFEQIDTSSGAVGSAVNRALGVLIPVLIMAPADPKTRAKWLERLYQAVLDDGVQYLFPVEQRWGEIAVYPELMNEYADRLTPSLQRVWSDNMPGGYLVGGTIGLSCLLEVGRYGDLLDLLATSRHRFWSDHRFGAEALARQGLVDAAIAYADGCRDPKLRSYDERAIDRFCEALLLRSGRADEAYQPMDFAPVWDLPTWRSIATLCAATPVGTSASSSLTSFRPAGRQASGSRRPRTLVSSTSRWSVPSR